MLQSTCLNFITRSTKHISKSSTNIIFFTQFPSKKTLRTASSLFSSIYLGYQSFHSLQSTRFSTKAPMSSTHVVLLDESKFDSQLKTSFESAQTAKQQLYLFITGGWCPDCTATEPNLTALKSAPSTYVLELPVERTKYRGIPQKTDCEGECKIEKHIYKTHPKLMVTAIPTLYKLDMTNFDATPTRLVESDCYDNDKFTAFTGVSV